MDNLIAALEDLRLFWVQAAPELNHVAAQGFVPSPLNQGHTQPWQPSEIHIKYIKTNSLQVTPAVQAQLIVLGL